MPAPGQAPAAAPARVVGSTSAPSVVMAPGMNPVEKIQALLQAERPAPPAEPAAAPAQETEAQPAASEAPQTAPTTEPQTEAAPQTEPAVEQEPAPSDAKPHEISLDELESVELEVTTRGEDGREIRAKRTVKELRDGFMMQADYSRKTAEVARQREAIPEEIRKGVESERAAYYQTLQSLQDLVVSSMDAELRNADWNALARDDPATYVRLDNRRKEIDRTLGEITTKQQELIQQRKTEQAKARDAQAAKSWEVLSEKIPGWDATKYQSLMKSGAETYGYKLDEVGSWVDHRAFEVLHDALEYRKLKSQAKPTAPIAAKKVVVVPKTVTPGTTAPVTAAQAREGKAMEQLRKGGTIKDAAAVIKARLG